MPLLPPVTTIDLPFMSSLVPLTTSVLLRCGAVDILLAGLKQPRFGVVCRLVGLKKRNKPSLWMPTTVIVMHARSLASHINGNYCSTGTPRCELSALKLSHSKFNQGASPTSEACKNALQHMDNVHICGAEMVTIRGTDETKLQLPCVRTYMYTCTTAAASLREAIKHTARHIKLVKSTSVTLLTARGHDDASRYQTW